MFLLEGCDYEIKPSHKFTAISQIGNIQEESVRLSKYDSPYTIGFKNEDGSNSLYIFDSPIQYESENGRYEIIDNMLVESDQENQYFENKSNEIKTLLPKSLKNSFQVVRQNDWKVVPTKKWKGASWDLEPCIRIINTNATSYKSQAYSSFRNEGWIGLENIFSMNIPVVEVGGAWDV